MARREPPVAAGRRDGRELHDLLGDPALGVRAHAPRAIRASSSSLAVGPIETPLPPDSPVGLTTSRSMLREHVLELLGVGQQVGPHVLEQRLLAEVVA